MNTLKQSQKAYFENLPECSICLNKIGKKKLFTTECNHKYHWKCINKWLDITNTCPYCRKIIAEDTEEIITEEELDIFFFVQNILFYQSLPYIL